MATDSSIQFLLEKISSMLLLQEPRRSRHWWPPVDSEKPKSSRLESVQLDDEINQSSKGPNHVSITWVRTSYQINSSRTQRDETSFERERKGTLVIQESKRRNGLCERHSVVVVVVSVGGSNHGWRNSTHTAITKLSVLFGTWDEKHTNGYRQVEENDDEI